MATTEFVRTDRSNKMISGVCGGLARYLGIDATIMRLIFVLAVVSGVTPLIYIVLWIVMPRESAQAPRTALPGAPTVSEPWKFDPYTGERTN